ncbi:helix-turn-helix transcriptional regulator [Primorskyibacter sp. 2E233]|uniref:helix-turn-helix transcriptional regulator n=1 Tax=Primorskyibacter sp. 2E233 TaxID=3413431 RepID=UPI003BF260B1
MAEITSFSGKTTSVDGQSLIDIAVADLMARVGERVRKARERKGIPRRVLSEMSGVSPRYLAQLESGEGNISIGLLKRVAVALDYRIEWLVGQDDPFGSEVMQVAEMFRTADRGTQQAVLRALSTEPSRCQRAGRICLVGLRGAGKSTLGKLAGEALNLPFVELNREIELTGGMPVDEIMALYGQEGYRKLEADALDRIVATYDRLILAVAGGIVAEPTTYNSLLGRFHTIWLKASPSEHMDRVRAQGDTRPMAGNPEAMAQLRSILQSREALYERAHAQLDTSGATVQDTLKRLQSLIHEQGFLN